MTSSSSEKSFPEVLESAEFIASKSQHVTISKQAIEATAKLFAKEQYSFRRPKPRVLQVDFEPAGLSETELLEWMFLIDCLNFCFWSDPGTEPFTVKFHDNTLIGSRSLVASLARAVEEGIKIYKPDVYGSLTMEQLKHVFRSENSTEIPLLQERLDILHDTAAVLKKLYDGHVCKLFEAAGKSAQKLLTLLGTDFKDYRDSCNYQGREVSFMKRGQLLIGDVWNRFGGRGLGEFHDINSLTMFADYRVPQGLLYFGILQYSEELMSVVKQGQQIPFGDSKEVEIRGCSIWAVELLRRQLSIQPSDDQDESVKTALLDHYLWKYAYTHRDEMDPFPYHRTITIFY